MTRLSDPDVEEFTSQGPKFSSDGRRFAIILKKGNLEHNTNEYTLRIFNTATVLSARKPEAFLAMSSSTNRDAIKGLKWLTNETVAFIGENVGSVPQVCEFNVRTKHLKQITSHSTPIVAYDISGDGRVVVFEADPGEHDPIDNEQTRREGLAISGERLDEILLESNRASSYVESRLLFVQIGKAQPTKIALDDMISPDMAPSVSPDGHFALIEVYARHIPTGWAAYKEALLHERVISRHREAGTAQVERYLLLDTRSGVVEPLLNAPKPWERDEFAWVFEGRSIVLSKAYLPLDIPDPAEREARENKTFVVEIKLPSREIVKITDQHLKVGRWEKTANRIFLRPRSSEPSLSAKAFENRGGQWQEAPAAPEDLNPQRPLMVTCNEGMNLYPKIFVSEHNGGHKTLLVDLNPEFQRLQFGKEETIRWMSTDGHEIEGGLYLPPAYKPGQRYPLVIQLSGFNEEQFWIDGPYSSAYAAQPLAAHDIVVLQVGRPKYKEYAGTTMEGPRQMAAYEGGIDFLDRRGLIDRNRVGIIGFSRAVFPAAFTLTHSKYRFAAATLAEGFDGGYWNYLAYPNVSAETVGVSGGPPFGDSFSMWLANSPTFNIFKVQTPIRLEAYSRATVIGRWEWYSLLWQMGKPVDFILLPEGSHLLVKPLERMVSLQGNVDWFAFWLKGDEDPDPSKREEYRRWHELRKLQDENEWNPPQPKEITN